MAGGTLKKIGAMNLGAGWTIEITGERTTGVFSIEQPMKFERG
jgi:hypothetical protein